MRKLISIVLLIVILTSCKREIYDETIIEEQPTSIQSVVQVCTYPFSDISRNPDIALKSNVHDSAYISDNYPVTANPIRFTPNHITTPYEALAYGWVNGEVVNKATLFCLAENIASRDWNYTEGNFSANDWVWDVTKGRLVIDPFGNEREVFDNLFRFDVFEKVNGFWQGLYSDYKDQFFPSVIEKDPYIDSMLNPFGVMQRYWNYYDYPYRQLHAQGGDIYFNPLRFPVRDGIFNTIATFNPQVNGCRVVKESRYDNNWFLAPLQIENGTLSVVDAQAAILKAISFTGTINKRNKTITFTVVSPYTPSRVYQEIKVRDSRGNVYQVEGTQLVLSVSPPFKDDYWVRIVIPGLGESQEIICIKK